MAEATAFNLAANVQAKRKLMPVFINTGTTETPVWTPFGVGTEDSSFSYNPDMETTTDIWGTTRTRFNKVEPTQDFTQPILGGNPILVEIYNNMKYDRLEDMSTFDVLIVRAWVGAEGAYEAERQTGCTLEVASEGGSAYVDQDVTLHYSNVKTHGTVDHYLYGETVTFTPAA